MNGSRMAFERSVSIKLSAHRVERTRRFVSFRPRSFIFEMLEYLVVPEWHSEVIKIVGR